MMTEINGYIVPACPFAGKLEGEASLSEVFYELSLSSYYEEDVSIGEGMGFACRFGKNFMPSIDQCEDILERELLPAEKELLANLAGVILREDSQGFVSCEYYFDDKELEEAWKDVVEEFSEFAEEDEE